jgi:transcriptional regulator with XRE-family HTH domain
MLSKRIILLRKRENLTQVGLAQKLSISRSRLSQYELGARQPDNEMLQKIAEFFNVSTDYLLGISDNPNTSKEDTYDSIEQINQLLKKYNIDQSGFFDIEKWKAMGPDEIRELESYFEYITSKAKKNRGD